MKLQKGWQAGIFIFIALFAAACGTAFFTEKFDNGTKFVSKTADGLAIKGYDAVAYRTIDDAVRGKPEYEYAWKGAKWLFTSPENRERFAADPEKFEPEYGGFCAWSLSEGSMMEADPESWKIVDGKLYLIQSDMVKEVWEKSEPALIEKSNENWLKMKNK
jgi:YHS domain-containing protein